jgi:hypothetical protein
MLALLAIVIMAACSPVGSKGTMPPPGANGQVDPAAAPDFIAIASRTDGGIAGYARKEDVLGPQDDPVAVYAEDLHTIVGHLVPGKGFIPAGVDPGTVVKIPVLQAGGSPEPSGQSVALYVRNGSGRAIYNAVVRGDVVTSSGSFDPRSVGAACYQLAEAARIVLLDRSAADGGAIVTDEIFKQGPGQSVESIWISVDPDGTIETGEGIPVWFDSGGAC